MADISLTKGDHATVILTFNVPSVRDITNDQVDFVVKKKETDTTPIFTKSSAGASPGITKPTPASGIAHVAIVPADLGTVGRDATLVFSARLTKSTGEVNTTAGTISVDVVP